MPRVFAALLLPHDVCDALARDAKAFARIDPLARFTRDWRRGHPPMTLPARTVPLSGPVLMETVKDPRTGMIRYRQVL